MHTTFRITSLSCLLLVLAIIPLSRASVPVRGDMALFVDATDIQRKLFHAELSIPVHAGPLTLAYPKWLYNAPVGSLSRMVGLASSADALREAIGRDRTIPLSLRVQNGSAGFETTLRDQRGKRYPRLQRIEGSDTLTEILKPRVGQGS